MAKLKESLAELGYDSIETYLQTGNIILKSGHAPDAIATATAGMIRNTFAVDTTVFVRSQKQMADLVADYPFADAEPNKAGVVFLDGAPSRFLHPKDIAPNETQPAQTNDLYVHCPTGFGKTTLTAARIEKVTKRNATRRNWKTIVKVSGLLDFAESL